MEKRRFSGFLGWVWVLRRFVLDGRYGVSEHSVMVFFLDWLSTISFFVCYKTAVRIFA